MGYDDIVDALTPFIPPFMRVNAKTWEELKGICPSIQQIQGILTLRALKYTVYFILWTIGLIWCEEGEIITLYIIGSIFLAILLNLGDKEKDSITVDDDGNQVQIPSAYSVFNERNQRLAGQLTAAQLERQIRNQGTHHNEEDNEIQQEQLNQNQEEDDDDADLREAIRRSLADSEKTKRTKGKERGQQRR